MAPTSACQNSDNTSPFIIAYTESNEYQKFSERKSSLRWEILCCWILLHLEVINRLQEICLSFLGVLVYRCFLHLHKSSKSFLKALQISNLSIRFFPFSNMTSHYYSHKSLCYQNKYQRTVCKVMEPTGYFHRT